MPENSPRIVLVPTPLGNLEDITLRALRVLKEADLVAAEDTRHSRKLFTHFGIETPMVSLHMHNEHHKSPELIARVAREGLVLAIITDAGTPGISDPGFFIVREAVEAGIIVETLPGPTAFVIALVSSGLPCDRFVFEGFLPQKKGRQTRILSLVEEERTLIFYESPHRILKTLESFVSFFGGNRKVAVCRELTKLHEEIIRGTLDEVLTRLKDAPIKGEIVIILAGKK